MYKRLSDQVGELVNPQRSDTFVRSFKEEVRQGHVKALYLPGERFTLPKEYRHRGGDDVYQKETREMLFEVTPEFEEWFEEENKRLSTARQGGQIKITEETIAGGLIDFDALAQQTQEKLNATFKRGQELGKSRKISRNKKKAAGSRSRKTKASSTN